MKKVIVENEAKEITLSQIAESIPIFASKNGKLVGLVAKCMHLSHGEDSWKILIGGTYIDCGGFDNRYDCIMRGVAEGYSFTVED